MLFCKLTGFVVLCQSNSAFYWNFLRRGLNKSVNSNWRGSPGHFSYFAPFYLKMAYYVKINKHSVRGMLVQ